MLHVLLATFTTCYSIHYWLHSLLATFQLLAPVLLVELLDYDVGSQIGRERSVRHEARMDAAQSDL